MMEQNARKLNFISYKSSKETACWYRQENATIPDPPIDGTGRKYGRRDGKVKKYPSKNIGKQKDWLEMNQNATPRNIMKDQ
jgi:hypothetical protein